MKILVGIKHVPHTETKIKPASDTAAIDETGIKWVMSPFDEYALEEALKIRDASGGEVVLVCAGREQSQTSLRQGLAMGADRAILIQDERFERCDALTRARALAAVAVEESAELFLVGKYGVGTDDGLTGPMLAELLDWPHAGAICELTLEAGAFTATREVEAAVETVQGTLPAVLTCEKGLNEPRLATLKGIMQSKKKTIDVKTPADLGLDPAALDQPMLIWESLELPAARSGSMMIDGEPRDAAEKLARVLRDEAKVI